MFTYIWCPVTRSCTYGVEKKAISEKKLKMKFPSSFFCQKWYILLFLYRSKFFSESIGNILGGFQNVWAALKHHICHDIHFLGYIGGHNASNMYSWFIFSRRLQPSSYPLNCDFSTIKVQKIKLFQDTKMKQYKLFPDTKFGGTK